MRSAPHRRMSGRHVVQRKMNYDDLPCNESACETHPDSDWQASFPSPAPLALALPTAEAVLSPAAAAAKARAANAQPAGASRTKLHRFRLSAVMEV